MPLLSRLSSLLGRQSTTPIVALEASEADKDGYSLAEAQWNETFQESLQDFQRKFKEEEEAQSEGERTRRDEFDRAMTNFGDIFLQNHLRRRELFKETDALQEEIFQRAEAAREAIFVQGQDDRARAFEIEQDFRNKRAELFNATRRELLAAGRQRLQDKCAALIAAFPDQISKSQSIIPPSPIPSPESSSFHASESFLRTTTARKAAVLDRSSRSRPIIIPPQPVLVEIPSPKPSSIFTPSLPSIETETSASTHEPDTIPLINSPSIYHPHNPSIQSASSKSHDQQEYSSFTADVSHQVADNILDTSFQRSQKERQEIFLKDERKRELRFISSDIARDLRERERNAIFDRKMEQWTRTESQSNHFLAREQGRLRGNTRRSTAFETSQERCWQIFDMSLSHIMNQAEGEAHLEEIWLQHQKRIIFPGFIPYEVLYGPPMYRKSVFGPSMMLEGPFIQSSLPVPTDSTDPNSHQLQETFPNSKGMQRLFEVSQEHRIWMFEQYITGRRRIFTRNEAKRRAEFVNAQQKRKELFDDAEYSWEIAFQVAQQQCELDFQASETKREDEFWENETERNAQARKAQEDREQRFHSMMLMLQSKCLEDEKRRWETLETWGQTLMASREETLRGMAQD